ncbi:heavy metal-responsive transcriptional regulator [Streptomyces sp. ISL-36]|uniref:heavy metal-responsive transcriptional regulator n=1 Tax=Streptomyces sp. ISL-36 TaxID=2819182 RepID=UPI001BE7B2D2|nr:heavy metal-responsive transcriptional regulator [Streptomyces sp. ISL-36]MBT2445281.1 heavy metal-responsive transcriptional regulator [Streptomyces sp. ISL-36]
MRIGDLATAGGVTAKTIRYYEQAGLMPPPPRTPGGYRDYPPSAESRLAFIRDAQHAGLTLAEIGGVLALRDSGEAPCEHVTALIDQHLEELDRRMAELHKTRTALRELAQRAAETDFATCSEAGICSIFSASFAREPGGTSTA